MVRELDGATKAIAYSGATLAAHAPGQTHTGTEVLGPDHPSEMLKSYVGLIYRARHSEQWCAYTQHSHYRGEGHGKILSLD